MQSKVTASYVKSSMTQWHSPPPPSLKTKLQEKVVFSLFISFSFLLAAALSKKYQVKRILKSTNPDGWLVHTWKKMMMFVNESCVVETVACHDVFC